VSNVLTVRIVYLRRAGKERGVTVQEREEKGRRSMRDQVFSVGKKKVSAAQL